jgi:hypothetical protein
MHYNHNLSAFKNKHLKQSAVVFGTGPTLSKFSEEDVGNWDNCIKIGVNSMVYHEKMHLDYYFCGHDASKESWHYHNQLKRTLLDQIIHRSDIGQVFCATRVNGQPNRYHFSDQESKTMGAINYGISSNSGHEHMKKDIDLHDLYNHSIIFSSLQFALYTGVEKIFLVGCDCGGGFSFMFPEKKFVSSEARSIRRHWLEFEKFSSEHYPDVEILSIRPVGLKGLFGEKKT